MFRRSDVVMEAGNIFRWGGHDYHCLADLSLWLRLLARGTAFYCAEGLSENRMHAGQEQSTVDGSLSCLLERRRIAEQAHAGGFLAGPGPLAAALAAARHFAMGTDFSRTPPDVARRIREELQAIDAALVRARGEPLAAPL
jgi:hypothetical protein